MCGWHWSRVGRAIQNAWSVAVIFDRDLLRGPQALAAAIGFIAIREGQPVAYDERKALLALGVFDRATAATKITPPPAPLSPAERKAANEAAWDRRRKNRPGYRTPTVHPRDGSEPKVLK